MPVIMKALLPIAFTCLITATVLIFIGRRDGVSMGAVYWQGSFIYRDLEKYIKSSFIKPIKLFSYIGLSSFIIAIFGGLVAYITAT